jgi:lysophospholipase L1-like esterase
MLGGRATVLGATSIGVLAGLSSAAWITMRRQADVVTRVIEAAALEMALAQNQIDPGVTDPTQLRPPDGDGVYLPDGSRVGRIEGGRDPLTLAMLGDSTSVGYGTKSAAELPGVLLAQGAAAALGRPVRLVSHGLIGSGAADLPRQIAAALPDAPDVVVINTGGNDVRDTIPPQRSAAQLGAAVATLRAQHIPVVVGTCPDFGVISPIPQPLRALVATWSRRLATMQAKSVTEAGGAAIPIGRLVSPHFLGRPDLFAPDHFHPSGLGYLRAVAALQPAVNEALWDAVAAANTRADQRTASSTAS